MKVLRPKFDEKGLVPVIVQHFRTKEVLMVAWANEEAYQLTLETGYTHFYSRSRNELWKKGGTSGNVQRLIGMPLIDCDGDTILCFVDPAGPACHTNERSCMYRSVSSVEAPEGLQTTEVDINW